MKYLVTGNYEDFNGYKNLKSFYLNPDKSLNPYTWSAPIKWEGYVDGIKVGFIQIDNLSDSLVCFDWKGFPDELAKSKSFIVEAIEIALKSMD